MAFPGLGEDSSDSSSSDEEDEAQRRAAWQKVLDNIAAEAEELGGRYREARGPRARKRRPHEAPGSRDARFMVRVKGGNNQPTVLIKPQDNRLKMNPTYMCFY